MPEINQSNQPKSNRAEHLAHPVPEASTTPAPKTAVDTHRDQRTLNQRIAEVSTLLPADARDAFERRAAKLLARVAEQLDQKRELERQQSDEERHEENSNAVRVSPEQQVKLSAHAPVYSVTAIPDANQSETGSHAAITRGTRPTIGSSHALADGSHHEGTDPADPMAALKRKQAEMLDKLTNIRQQTKEKEQGQEAGE